MNKLVTLALAAILSLLVSVLRPIVVHAQTPTAQEIIAAGDRVRNPGVPFRLTNTLTEYKDGKPASRSVLAVFAKLDSDSGQFRNIVRFIDPPRDQGKLVLMDGTKMWFYDPASKASVPISPQQRLVGQASDGDVVTVNYARDYTPKLLGDEKLLDADRKERDCWHLELTAANTDAVYARMELWLEKGTYFAVKTKHYSDSGRLLKIAYYHKFTDALGGPRPAQTIIIDAVDPKLVTTMDNTDWRTAEIADSWFQRDYLPRLQLEK
jgi:outer membrane lipoprotein-sorting protein